MISLTINNRKHTFPSGTTVLQAAQQMGISIPTMCYMQGYSNHPSCMVCVVKDKRTGHLFPSCAMPVAEGMDIQTDDKEVLESRKEALELLLSDHVGDCVAPCRIACPAFMDIPKMNRLIARGKFDEALKVVKEEIALPLILGTMCSAPCENACRRKTIDEPVSICLLKRFVAVEDYAKPEPYFPPKETKSVKKVAVIGAGPAGLAAAFHLTQLGYQTMVIDRNGQAGGSLLQSVTSGELDAQTLQTEIDFLQRFGVEFRLNTKVNESFLLELKTQFDAILLASGASGKSLEGFIQSLSINKETFTTSEPTVFACGSLFRPLKMAVSALAQGKQAARSIHLFLQDQAITVSVEPFNSRFGKLEKEEFSEYLKEAISDSGIIPEKGKGIGFNREEAMKEAARCLHCDCRKPDSCKLRIYATEYQVDRKEYQPLQRNRVTKQFTHELVVYEPEKCIRCGLCIDITQKEKELVGLTFVGRGFDVRVQVPFSHSVSNALIKTAKLCADACPTGALSIKLD